MSEAPGPDAPREPSSECAFESRDALCASLRATYRAYSPWVGASCGYAARQVRNGPIAEAMYIGIRHSYAAPGASAVFVERPFLDGTMREPENAEPLSTQLVLAVRIGSVWYPASVFVGPRGAENTQQDRISWSLDDDGRFLEWTEEEGASLRDQGSGYGRTERTLLSTDGRAPRIVARETLERWDAEVDSPCAEACNSVRTPPPYPECDRRCATVVTTTRTWTRTPDALRIGASTTRIEGRPSPDARENSAESSPARTYDLGSRTGWMSTCGFTPVRLAVPPAALSDDPEDVAARARAIEVMRHGSWRELPQARATVAEGSAEAC